MNQGHIRFHSAVMLALLMTLSGCKLLDRIRNRGQDAGQNTAAADGGVAPIALPNPTVAPLGQYPDAGAAVNAAMAAAADASAQANAALQAAQAAAADASAQANAALQAAQAAVADAGAAANAAMPAPGTPAPGTPAPVAAAPGTPAPGTPTPVAPAPIAAAPGTPPPAPATPRANAAADNDADHAHHHHGAGIRNFCKDHPGALNPATGSTCPMIASP